MTLIEAAFGPHSRPYRAVQIAAGAGLVAVAAQISIGVPVPMSLQTLAVLMVGFALGARGGALALTAYLAAGAAGLPVFANGMNGAAFFGPTAGFLVGFVGLAWLAGRIAETWLTCTASWRGLALAFAATLIASLALYVPGVLWPMTLAGLAGLDASWVGEGIAAVYWPHFVAPFLAGDVIKAAIAVLLTGAARAVLRRS